MNMTHQAQNAMNKKEDTVMIMIDPPSGWKYGFPMVFDMEEGGDVNEWLVSKGYPQSLIDKFKGALPYRMWEQEDEQSI
jgi:hypothetical protein